MRDEQRAAKVADLVQDGLAANDISMLNQIIDSIGDPIFVKNEDLAWILVNESFCDFIGFSRDELLGRTDADIFPAKEAAVFNEMDRGVFLRGEPNINEELLTSAKTGQQHTIRTTKTSFRREGGQRVLVGIFTDLTELREAQRELEVANEQLRRLALFDVLTDLPNRRSFEETLDRSLVEAHEREAPLAVIFCDLNGFKQVNDAHGHEIGDALIRTVGSRISAVCQAREFVARLGGDEFVVIAGDADRQGVLALADQIGAAIGRPMQLAGNEISVTASIGIACFPDHGRGRQELIRAADLAMFHAKHVTHRGVEFYDDEVLAHRK